MEIIVKFVTVIAWIFGPLSGLRFVQLLCVHVTTSDIKKIQLALEGRQIKPLFPSFLVLVLCVAWIIVQG